MGYTQETTWNIVVPVANLAILFENYNPPYAIPEAQRTVLWDSMQALVQEFGEHSDVTPKVENDELHIVGWTAGRVGDDTDAVDRLNSAKASGTIDIKGEEDEHWRLRFHGDGRMTEHAGKIVYDES